MKSIKVWPHLTIVAVLVALLAGLGVAFYLKHEQTAQAEALPMAARIQRVDGEVAFNDSIYAGDENAQQNQQWVAAIPNQSFSVGDRIYTRDNSRASLAFSGRNYARLDPNTGLDVLTLADGRTQLALREGSAFFDVGDPDELFEVGTPYGAVDFVEPGLYNVGFDDNGNVLVSALSGVAQLVGLSGSGGRISKGELLTIAGQTAAQIVLSKLNGDDAGYLVDDYYSYQYPDYDGRYNNYDAYLSDPFYYDPYRRNTSYQYVSSIIPGVNDLDYYGDWQNIDGYGYSWHPRVDANWVPYQQGYWVNDYPYGLTWVSTEPWGYAPYHYGRWANVGNQWYWVPDGVNSTPTYSPALVAFLPFTDQVGWVPLGPGDPYVPRYYDQNWQPHYFGRGDLAPTQLVNLAIPSAVTVIPIDSFGRIIDPRIIRRLDPQVVRQVRPTLEPFAATPLRNAALHSAWGRGKIDLPPGIAKKLDERRVFVGEAPTRKGLAKALRVDSVHDRGKKEDFKVRDDRRNNQPAIDRHQNQRLAREAERGNRQQIQKQEHQQREQEKNQRKALQQPQGQRVAQPAARPVQREVPRAKPNKVQGQRAPRAAQREVPRSKDVHAQGQRVGNPAKQSVPRETRPPQPVHRPGPPQPAEPRRQAQQQQQQQPKREARQQSPGAQKQSPGAQKKASNPAPSGGQPQGAGKGKGKKP